MDTDTESLYLSNEVDASQGQAAETQEASDTRAAQSSRLTTHVWEYFSRKIINGEVKAICNGYKRKLVGGSRSGTSHLANHICRCAHKQLRVDVDQAVRHKVDGKKTGHTFDEEIAKRDLCQMIILHEYPLSLVDHIGFKKYFNTLQPLFKVPSRRTVTREIKKLHDDFKKKVMNLLDGNEGRIAINTDMWTSDHHKKGYMAVTAHFIDNGWNIQKRIIRFEYVPAPHSREVIVRHLMNSLLDWNIDRKLSTITVDNCSVNDCVVSDLINRISKDHLLLDGAFFHMRCCTHILNLIVRSGLDIIEESIEKIRDSVLFWIASPKRIEKFDELAHQLRIPTTKKLSIDCRTRWNSTYLMLASAISYRKVFERCEKTESGFKIAITESDWDKAVLICEKLKLFHLVTEKFSGTKYPTANLYFPSICNIQLALRKWVVDPNTLSFEMAKSMLIKFEKYWKDVQGIMGVATLLDPRYKKLLLRYFFEMLYEHEEVYEEVEKIVEICSNLVREYEKSVFESPVASSSSFRLSDEDFITEHVLIDFDDYAMRSRRGRSGGRSELERFLNSDVMPRESDFDILSWWKINGPTFPILQKIARDIYVTPVSTVASESAFSTGGRLVSPHRNRLDPIMVEALACTQNWLQSENKVLLEKFLSSPQFFLEDIEQDDEAEDSDDDHS